MGTVMRLAGSFVVAFFLAGAVLFLVFKPDYLPRAVVSLGLMSVLDGIESVLRAGLISKCSLFGSCREHSVRGAGFVLWALVFAAWTWKRMRHPAQGDDSTGAPGPRDRTDSTDDVLRRHATGEFSGWRTRPAMYAGGVAVLAVVVAVFVGLVAPFAARSKHSTATPPPVLSTPGTQPARAATVDTSPAPPRGLTFATTAAGQGPVGTGLACHGVPTPVDHPRNGTCDPYAGDTDCRAALPIACIDAESGALGATAPVTGTALGSRLAASDLCRARFGSTWRMARFHDRGGWEIPASATSDLPSATRLWVAIDDQMANCWDHTR